MSEQTEKPRVRVTTDGVVRGVVPAPARSGPGAAFMRGGISPTMLGWNPALRDQGDEIWMSWERATARATDLIHNSGWIAGAIDQAVANTVGTGLRLVAVPDAAALGWTTEAANEWARLVERRFELWGRNPLECDLEGRRTFGQMQAVSFRGWFPTGEIVSEMAWRQRPVSRSKTKVRLIPPHRLSRTTFQADRLAQGVYMDRDGLPLAYRFRRKIDGVDQDLVLPARDAAARPRVVHVFDGVAGTVRGITPLVPALQVARQFDQLHDAKLTSALIEAAFAATITANEPTEQVIEGLMTPQELAKMKSAGLSTFDAWCAINEGWYKNTTIDVGIKGRFAHLMPGQKLEFHSSKTSSADYKTQALFLLRELMRCLGLTFESGTGDYTGATYSSVRMATGEVFQITLYRRKHIVAPFCQPVYEGWLEEEIDAGLIPFPDGIDGFLANRAAACRAEWRGTAKPQADDLKLAKAHETWDTLGVISDEMMAADLGVDIEDVYEQRKREADMRKQYGLPPKAVPGAPRDPVSDKLVTQKDD